MAPLDVRTCLVRQRTKKKILSWLHPDAVAAACRRQQRDSFLPAKSFHYYPMVHLGDSLAIYHSHI